MANRNIDTGELDFSAIKDRLKVFLSSQEQFQDYDFEGSSLSILIELLAYNTMYNSLYKNLAINETFLDSASKRESVVSRAKDLGYVSASARAPVASVDVRVINPSSTPDVLTLPKYTPFSTMFENTQYTFYTTEDITTELIDSQYLFENINIVEGTPLTYKFTVATGTRYVIPNANVDLSTLKVSVRSDALSFVATPYTNADSILDIDNESLVYFVKEIAGELYEIEFGDGRLGKALEIGNVVDIEYIVTNKSEANKAKTFTYQGAILAGGQVTVTTKVIADGGADIEDIENVRFSAPKYRATQNRAVIPDDYSVLLKKSLPTIQAINSWGGEDNVPPVYGKVFICIKPADAPYLTQNEKTRLMTDVLKKKKTVTAVPVIVDPKYINIAVNSTVYYNPNATTRNTLTIATLINEVIQDYNTSNLERFGAGFRMSQLSRLIDDADVAIVSNITTIRLEVPVEPAYNLSTKYVINLGNPISNDHIDGVLSTGFRVVNNNTTYYIADNQSGGLYLFSLDATGNRITANPSVGTVDYATGDISINQINISSVDGEFMLKIKPESYDVISVRDQIVQIPDSLITVNTVVDNIAVGNSQGGTNFTFTSSRS